MVAGLALEWSNGPTEGQVHRLKVIKRQMYGRASFPALSAPMLPSPRRHRPRHLQAIEGSLTSPIQRGGQP